MLLIGVGLLGVVVGSVVGYLLAKRGTVVEVPNKGLYYQGLLDGYDAAYAGLTIDLRHKDKLADNPTSATHALLWYPVTTESGILWAKAGTASPKGIVLEQDRHAA